MADSHDIAAVIASALTEISVNGTLAIEMDGQIHYERLGGLSGEAVSIVVTVQAITR